MLNVMQCYAVDSKGFKEHFKSLNETKCFGNVADSNEYKLESKKAEKSSPV